MATHNAEDHNRLLHRRENLKSADKICCDVVHLRHQVLQ
jgi:hypothetical protein